MWNFISFYEYAYRVYYNVINVVRKCTRLEKNLIRSAVTRISLFNFKIGLHLRALHVLKTSYSRLSIEYAYWSLIFIAIRAISFYSIPFWRKLFKERHYPNTVKVEEYIQLPLKNSASDKTKFHICRYRREVSRNTFQNFFGISFV